MISDLRIEPQASSRPIRWRNQWFGGGRASIVKYRIMGILDQDVIVGWISDTNNASEVDQEFYDYCNTVIAKPIEELPESVFEAPAGQATIELKDKVPDMNTVVYGFVSNGQTLYIGIEEPRDGILATLAHEVGWGLRGSSEDALGRIINSLLNREAKLSINVPPATDHKIAIVDLDGNSFRLMDGERVVFSMRLDRFVVKYL